MIGVGEKIPAFTVPACVSLEKGKTLDALQTDELCPCNWEKGQSTLVA